MHLSLLELILLSASGVIAGALGAMLGIGGGIILIPVLVLGFGVPIHAAIAAGLVAVIATSTAAGTVYVGKGLTNMRLAMTLELTTTAGAISGGLLAAILAARALAGIFAVFTMATAIVLLRKGSAAEVLGEKLTHVASGYEVAGELAGSYYDPSLGRSVDYQASGLPAGLGVSFVAGNVSGLLGVGGGFLNVPAMNLGMKIPIKVAAATSNFMIGVTAAASLVIYFQRGFLEPLVATPVALGVTAGALRGTRLAGRVSSTLLARLLSLILLIASVEMALKSAGVGVGR